MKLNMGCGNHYVDGWTNVDVDKNDQVRPDIQASFLEPLPAQIQDVTHVYLGHVLEHLPFGVISPALSRLWERCVPGVRIAVVGPDCDKAREMDRRSALWGIELNAILHGAGRWANDVHLWECTPGRLETLLERSGVHNARRVDIRSEELSEFPVTSRVAWQCALIATLESEGS